jgi:hypothetical protein
MIVGKPPRPAARGDGALRVAYAAPVAENRTAAASRPAGGTVRPGRRVLHPTDYSDTSAAAFEVACDLAGPDGRVTVLHVAEPVYSPLGLAQLPPPRPGYRGAWEAQLRMVRPADPAVGVAHRLAEGHPAAEIVRAARGGPGIWWCSGPGAAAGSGARWAAG